MVYRLTEGVLRLCLGILRLSFDQARLPSAQIKAAAAHIQIGTIIIVMIFGCSYIFRRQDLSEVLLKTLMYGVPSPIMRFRMVQRILLGGEKGEGVSAWTSNCYRV